MTQKYLGPEMRVIEFGCGTGSTAVLHAPLVESYRAIDVSEKMVELGRAKASESGLSNLEFEVGTLEQATNPETRCEAVLGLNILHLVPDLEGTLATVSRLLVPGGFFFSSTVCLKDVRGSLRMIGQATRVLPFFPTVTPLSVGELEARFANAGLAIEERFEQRPGIVFLVAVSESEQGGDRQQQ